MAAGTPPAFAEVLSYHRIKGLSGQGWLFRARLPTLAPPATTMPTGLWRENWAQPGGGCEGDLIGKANIGLKEGGAGG